MRVKGLFSLGIILLSTNLVAFATEWSQVASGIDSMRSSSVTAFRIDPARYKLKSVLAKNTVNDSTAFVANLGKASNALIAINGGYFSVQGSPLGLRLSNYKVLSRRKNISWWGIFYIQDHIPYLSASNQFTFNKNISFAIQAGPRLLVDGNIPKLKEGLAARSALGITRDNKIIIAITDGLSLSLTQWAKVLKKIGCHYALNLDGGTSSQLYVKMEGLNFQIPNYKPVTDAVIVER